jgi:esterase/lipase superfamily enzyme
LAHARAAGVRMTVPLQCLVLYGIAVHVNSYFERGQTMKAHVIEKLLMMGFAITIACAVGSYTSAQLSHFSDVFAKVATVTR